MLPVGRFLHRRHEVAMDRDSAELIAKAIYDGLHEIAQAVSAVAYHIAEDATLAETIHAGLEKAARIAKGFEE